MLVGFSQGGILAGHLAAYRSDDDNFGAVVVCGAPIDNMPIPDRTRVISVQHEGDPVPKLGFFTPPPTRPNWQTITSAAPGNPTDVTKIHDAGQYARGEQLHRNGVLLMPGMRRGWTVAADSRVASATVAQGQSGFSSGGIVEVVMSGEDPVTSDGLSARLLAARHAGSREPGHIDLFTKSQSGASLDLTAAADQLGILYSKIGDGIDVSSGGINDALGTGR
ncbi:hypothetical protein [Microbacterium laevaniformans]|uniref:hypothetical protein n=1 Tax=Microbacterium laevaniformans TaxID=36807 RepID=UPI003626C619